MNHYLVSSYYLRVRKAFKLPYHDMFSGKYWSLMEVDEQVVRRFSINYRSPFFYSDLSILLASRIKISISGQLEMIPGGGKHDFIILEWFWSFVWFLDNRCSGGLKSDGRIWCSPQNYRQKGWESESGWGVRGIGMGGGWVIRGLVRIFLTFL